LVVSTDFSLDLISYLEGAIHLCVFIYFEADLAASIRRQNEASGSIFSTWPFMLEVADGGLKESAPCFTAESAVQATPGRPRLNSKKTAHRLMSFRVAIMTSVTSLF